VRLDRHALKLEVERLLSEESPPELLAGNTEVLFALDTVPVAFDLRAALGLLYGAQLAGFYEPKTQRMVLASDLGSDAERLTLYHELVHALQDQHYQLSALLDWQPGASDALSALHALAEGDATSAMLEVYAASMGATGAVPPDLLRLDSLLTQATPELASVPTVITRSLLAPYVDGLAFVTHVRKQAGGWAAVDRAWRQRPTSTEQILHPEKLWANEAVVPLPPLTGPAGYEQATFRDVLGEQALRILFEEWAPAAVAAEAASGWGGDRLGVFAQGEQRLVALHLVFDTTAAAERALVTFARGALRHELAGPANVPLRPFMEAGAARAAARSGSLCQLRRVRGPFAIARHGSHIGVVLGPYTGRGTDVRASGTCADASRWASAIATR
jgi:hypothetical protein